MPAHCSYLVARRGIKQILTARNSSASSFDTDCVSRPTIPLTSLEKQPELKEHLHSPRSKLMKREVLFVVGNTEVSLEKAIVHYAGPYMLAAKAQALINTEVSKGCDGHVLPNPVALEPVFVGLNMTKDIMTLKDQPSWIYEPPPQQHELVRYQVWLSPDQSFSWKCLELFIKQLSIVSRRVGLEIWGNQRRIVITVLCHHRDDPTVVTAFLSKLRSCRLSIVGHDLVFGTTQEMWQATSLCDFFPPPPYTHLLTRPDELHSSPYEALIAAIADIPPPAQGIYQVLFQPVSPNHNWHRNIEMLTDLEYIVKQVENIGMGNIGHSSGYTQQAPSGAIHQMAGDIETKAHNDKPLYSAAFRVAVIGNLDERERYLQSLSVFSGLFQHGGRPLEFKTEAQYFPVLSCQEIRQMFLLGLTYRPGFLVNSAELTGLAHFPATSALKELSIPLDTIELLAGVNDQLTEGTPIGTSGIAGQEQIVCIPNVLRLCHTHMVGKPRTGKSTLEELMIIHDIKAGHGVAVLDPHHDMVDRLLSLIPEEEIGRVIYFDPGSPDWVPLWNPLQPIPGQNIGRMTDDLIGVFKSFVTGWGDRMEHLMRQAIFGLLHLPGSTLLDVYDLLRYNSHERKTLRSLILKTVQNEVARQFWMQDFENYRPDELGPAKHKLSKLLLSDAADSLMFSQPQSRFNFRHIMDDGMIFLADLSSNIGKQVKEVLGGFILAVMYVTALSRSDIPLNKRRPFHIYLDEGYHFTTDTLEEIIAETRKYGVSVTIAHQFLRQFDVKKIDALGTVGTTIVFNVDTRDAGYLCKDFKKQVTVEDFSDLGQREAIVRCGTEIIKIKTLQQLQESESNFRDRIIAESRRKYCMPAPEVRRIIERRNERANQPYEALAPVINMFRKNSISEEFKYEEL